MFGYRVPAPDDAMLISGGKHGQGVPFRVVVGRGAFIMPMFRKVRFLTLAMQESEVSEQCVTKSGITLNVKAVIAFKVGNDEESLVNAGQRFVSDETQMPAMTGRIFAGHLRSIVGAMTVEDIIQQRQTLATEILDASKIEMAKIGLIVDSLQIESIDDNRSGYIDAMGQAQRAEVGRQAAVAKARAEQATQIAEAQAAQAAAEAQQESERNQSDFAKQTSLVKTANETEVATATAQNQAKVQMVQAQNKAQVQQAQATADQAGPLAQAKAQKEVVESQTVLQQQQAKLTEQTLQVQVVKPAEAEAAKVKVTAVAEAEKQRILAEAATAGNRVSLEQQLITMMPQIVQAAASGLNGANLTVLNGADGVGEIVTQVVGQGLAILDTLKAGVKLGDNQNGNGQAQKEITKR